MTTSIKVKLNESDEQTYIDKYKVTALLILKKQNIISKYQQKLDENTGYIEFM